MTPRQQITRAQRYMRQAWVLHYDCRATKPEHKLDCDVQMHLARAHDALVLAAKALIASANIELVNRAERANIVHSGERATIVMGDREYRVDFK